MVTADRARSLAAVAVLISAAAIWDRPLSAQSRGPSGPRIPSAVAAQARGYGSARVIVGLNVAFTPESYLGVTAVQSQRASIAGAQGAVLRRMLRANPRSVRRFTSIPFLALEVDEVDLQVLASSPEVNDIQNRRSRRAHTRRKHTAHRRDEGLGCWLHRSWVDGRPPRHGRRQQPRVSGREGRLRGLLRARLPAGRTRCAPAAATPALCRAQGGPACCPDVNMAPMSPESRPEKGQRSREWRRTQRSLAFRYSAPSPRRLTAAHGLPPAF